MCYSDPVLLLLLTQWTMTSAYSIVRDIIGLKGPVRSWFCSYLSGKLLYTYVMFHPPVVRLNTVFHRYQHRGHFWSACTCCQLVLSSKMQHKYSLLCCQRSNIICPEGWANVYKTVKFSHRNIIENKYKGSRIPFFDSLSVTCDPSLATRPVSDGELVAVAFD